MARQKTSYVCGTCGARTAQWQGQCPACEAWNTLEVAVSSIAAAGASRNARTVTAGPSTSRTVTDIAQESDVRAATGIGAMISVTNTPMASRAMLAQAAASLVGGALSGRSITRSS